MHTAAARDQGRSPTIEHGDQSAVARRPTSVLLPFEPLRGDEESRLDPGPLDDERRLFGGVRLAPTATALEYGCGRGRGLLRFATLFARLDGVDAHAHAADVARRRCTAADLPSRVWTSPPGEVPAGDGGPYDVVYSLRGLDDADDANHRSLLDSLFRLLKPGGLLTLQMAWDGDTPLPADSADASVPWPASLGAILREVGFATLACAVTAPAPGETCAAWICIRARRPDVPGTADPMPDEWAPYGFTTLTATGGSARRALLRCLDARESARRGRNADARRQDLERREELAQARQREAEARARDVETRAEEVEARGEEVETRAQEIEARSQLLDARQQEVERRCEEMARDAAELREAHDGWRHRAAEWQAESAGAALSADLLWKQLVRVQAADRDRLRSLVNGCVTTARTRGWSIVIFGAGLHTEWLLRETALREVPRLQIFDSNPDARGRRCAGLPVYPAAEMTRAKPDVVIVSSLAFQDDMAAFVEGLAMPDVHVVCCYPSS